VAEHPLGRWSERVVRRRDDDVLWTEQDDAVVLLDVRASRYLTLNQTGALLWRQLAQPAVQLYPVGEAEATTALADFLDALDARDLLEASDPRTCA
jgi:hypothetical protein